MRCKPIRTVLRAALAAGLLATCQNAPLSASWNDYLHPSADICYLHDLQWENFYSASNAAEHFTKSIVKTDGETTLATDLETEACVAAAKRFEINMQVDAVLASLRSRLYQLSEAGAELFHGYSQSRTLLVSTIESRSLMLVDWIKTPDMLPVTVVVTQSSDDFECGWNCGDWRRDIHNSVSASLPPRELANIFVYTFEDAVESCETDDSSAINEPSICCPMERTVEAISTEISTAPAVIAMRPPTLESEYEALEAANDLKVYQYGDGYCLTGIENQCPPDLASSVSPPTDEITEATELGNDAYCDPWCDSWNWSPWSSRSGKRFAFGDNAPRMPEAGPAIAAYSKEDLEFASTYSAKILDELAIGTQQLENAMERIQEETESNETKFSPKDFLITSHTSAYGSISLPLLDSNRLVLDYAMKIIAEPTAEPRSQVSNSFATQIRTVGQFLVDFASQIENQTEQIELARRETNQR